MYMCVYIHTYIFAGPGQLRGGPTLGNFASQGFFGASFESPRRGV